MRNATRPTRFGDESGEDHIANDYWAIQDAIASDQDDDFAIEEAALERAEREYDEQDKKN